MSPSYSCTAWSRKLSTDATGAAESGGTTIVVEEKLVGNPTLNRRLTDRALAGGDSLAGARVVDVSPCPRAHNTTLPLERSPATSFKRRLGSRAPRGEPHVPLQQLLREP